MNITKITIAILVVGIVGVGGYGFVWNKQAKSSKIAIENFVTKINLKANKKISYDKISMSGFPMKIIANIKNPKFSSDNNKLILNGDIAIGANYFSKDVFLSFDGRMTIKRNNKILNWIADFNNNKCGLKLNKTANMSINSENIFSVFTDKKKLTKAVDSVHCSSNGFAILNKKTDKKAIFFEDNNISFNNKKLAVDKYKLDFLFDLKGLKFGEEYVNFLFSMQNKEIADLAEIQRSYKDLLQYFGATNIKFALDYTGSLKNDKQEDIHLKVSSLKIENKLYNLNMPFEFNVSPAKSKGSLIFNYSYHIDDKINKYMLDNLNIFTEQVIDGMATYPKSTKLESTLNISQRKQKISSALKRYFHDIMSISDMKITINGDVSGLPSSLPTNPIGNIMAAMSANLNLKNLSIMINGEGLHIKAKKKANNLSANISCIKCEAAINDFTKFIVDTSDFIQIKKNTPKIPTSMIMKNKQKFIEIINDLAIKNGEDRIFNIKAENNIININNRPIKEIIMLVMQKFSKINAE